ncbi:MULTISPECIES: hypothetical protein [Prevotella]|uniref:Uncharacterized protein n=1 Tax=Prevotella herbatica TaxID=2801997 RepID=A0ABN6EIJ3_9BACT|nr:MULTISPECIES: hypothetical protein [Prevotella]MDN5554962.1 hypothetical protein [Prevotella sp.]BCS85765.1 hypothetical protein prwr041_16580 [Prevotella herbatica]
MNCKKNYFLPVITAILILLSSCSDEINSDIIYDIAPINFNFKIVNKDGNNMLDSKGPGYNPNFIANTSITIQSKTYKLGVDAQTVLTPSTRAYYAPFKGMMIGVDNGETYAVIGPFMGNYNWDNEKVIINWGDNSTDILTFSSFVHYKKSGEPYFDRSYILNNSGSSTVFDTAGYITLEK